jgi:hypothetical protein
MTLSAHDRKRFGGFMSGACASPEPAGLFLEPRGLGLAWPESPPPQLPPDGCEACNAGPGHGLRHHRACGRSAHEVIAEVAAERVAAAADLPNDDESARWWQGA